MYNSQKHLIIRGKFMSKKLLILAFVLVLGFVIGQNTKDIEIISKTQSQKNLTNTEIIKNINNEQIKLIKFLEISDEKKYYATIRRINESPYENDDCFSSGDKLSVFDENGNSVYELKEFGIDSIDSVRLKMNFSQFIVETNGGGTDDHLMILDYKDGKFAEMETGNSKQLRGGWWTMPEYRSNVKGAYYKSAQLIVIQQIGGADINPKASVFRNQNGKFQKVGEILMNKLGDFIEKQLVENKKDEQK